MEKWVLVVDTDEKYSVSDLGRVKSNMRGRVIEPYLHTSGYFRVNLGRKKRRYIHRLIAEAFIPNPHGKPCVDHIDGDRKNNGITNLRWVTHQENAIYGGERHGWKAQKNGAREHSKHAKNAALYRKLLDEKVSLREIARRYKTSHSSVSRAVRTY